MEYLYQSGDMAVFMDLESYDQHELPKEVVGDLQLFVLPNTQIIVLWCDGKPISVELPLTVTLEITDTPPGIKGATATNPARNKRAAITQPAHSQRAAGAQPARSS